MSESVDSVRTSEGPRDGTDPGPDSAWRVSAGRQALVRNDRRHEDTSKDAVAISPALAGTRDYSGSFGKVRPHVINSRGETLSDFAKALKPNYFVVYRDIALGHILLIGTLALAIVAERLGAPPILVAVPGAISVGYWLAYLHLFIHEGAHWNLAPQRETSDRLCNLLISWWVGLEVKKYRKVHFQHHRALGTVDDSEHSYFFPLNVVFIAKALLVVRALEVVAARRKVLDKRAIRRSQEVEGQADGPGLHKELVIGALVHTIVVAVLLWMGLWGSAAVWGAGAVVAFPFFATLRQLLEHRDEHARADVDYRKTDHGALARMFGDGLIARTFGGAGFNRHLLHHWEPGISYTRLPDLERFLKDTDLRPIIESRKTTYGRIFWRLFRDRAAHGAP
jgi:fatty acid desaturase